MATWPPSGWFAANYNDLGQDASRAAYNWTPSDHGALGWTYDPSVSSGSATLSTAGRIEVARIHVPVGGLCSNINLVIGTGGATLTTGQCFAALFNSAGTLLGTSVDQATAWGTSGPKPAALVTPVTIGAGDYYAGLWFNGTTSPSFLRQGNHASINLGLSAPNFRFAAANTGLTTAAPATLGAQSAISNAWWAALS